MFPFTAAVVPMDVQQQVAAQVRVEERYRNGTDIDTLETEVDPVFKYDFIWKGGQNHFVALYQPRLILSSNSNRVLPNSSLVNLNTLNLQPINENPFSALHNGGVGYEQVGHRYRLTLYQFAAYGSLSTTALLVPPVWEGGLPPDPNPIIPSTIGARFTLIFVQTQAFAPIRLSPRLALIPGFVYNVFGGADKESRGVIALTSGPGASVALEYAATKADRLISTVGVGQINTTFQDDRDNVSIFRTEATQIWRHYFGSNLASELMGGASVGGDEINGYTLYSLGHAALLWDSWSLPKIPPGAAPYAVPEGRGNRLQFAVAAKVAPWIDLFSGDLEQRLVFSTAANYTMGRVTLRGQASQGRVINTPRSVAQYQVVFTDLGVRFRLLPSLFADSGVRIGYQDFNNAVRFNQLTQVQGYVSLTYAPLAARF